MWCLFAYTNPSDFITVEFIFDINDVFDSIETPRYFPNTSVPLLTGNHISWGVGVPMNKVTDTKYVLSLTLPPTAVICFTYFYNNQEHISKNYPYCSHIDDKPSEFNGGRRFTNIIFVHDNSSTQSLSKLTKYNQINFEKDIEDPTYDLFNDFISVTRPTDSVRNALLKKDLNRIQISRLSYNIPEVIGALENMITTRYDLFSGLCHYYSSQETGLKFCGFLTLESLLKMLTYSGVIDNATPIRLVEHLVPSIKVVDLKNKESWDPTTDINLAIFQDNLFVPYKNEPPEKSSADRIYSALEKLGDKDRSESSIKSDYRPGSSIKSDNRPGSSIKSDYRPESSINSDNRPESSFGVDRSFDGSILSPILGSHSTATPLAHLNPISPNPDTIAPRSSIAEIPNSSRKYKAKDGDFSDAVLSISQSLSEFSSNKPKNSKGSVMFGNAIEGIRNKKSSVGNSKKERGANESSEYSIKPCEVEKIEPKVVTTKMLICRSMMISLLIQLAGLKYPETKPNIALGRLIKYHLIPKAKIFNCDLIRDLLITESIQKVYGIYFQRIRRSFLWYIAFPVNRDLLISSGAELPSSRELIQIKSNSTLSFKNFWKMCSDFGIIDSGISLNNVITCFVSCHALEEESVTLSASLNWPQFLEIWARLAAVKANNDNITTDFSSSEEGLCSDLYKFLESLRWPEFTQSSLPLFTSESKKSKIREDIYPSISNSKVDNIVESS